MVKDLALSLHGTGSIPGLETFACYECGQKKKKMEKKKVSV